jgi:tripartite-type tricarboxylate transporter receptor subunit TctC
MALRAVLGPVTAIAMAAIAIASTPSAGESYPSRPLRLVVGQSPGGYSDVLGRMIAQRFSEILNQPVVVENRGGASGTIAAESVARAPGDGYTLLFAGSSNLALAPTLMKDLRYDPLELAPVGTIGRVSFGLAVNPKLPIASIADLVRYARAHPGRLNYGSAGVTSTAHMIFELLKKAAGIDIVHVPYRNAPGAVQEVATGRIDMVLTDVALLMPLVNNGSLRLIAVASPKRSREAPDVATVAEQGYPELALEPWYGIVAPAGTPDEIIAKLSETLIATLRTPEVRERIDRLGIVPLERTPDELKALIRTEMKAFGALTERLEVNKQP